MRREQRNQKIEVNLLWKNMIQITWYLLVKTDNLWLEIGSVNKKECRNWRACRRYDGQYGRKRVAEKNEI